MDHEARSLRLRHAELIDALELIDQPSAASNMAVVQTTTVSSYPTSAQAYYAVEPAQLGGTESEGGSVSITPDSMRVFYALNLGSGVPPSGTTLVAHACSGRWCFSYNATS